jgi:hypothetical protein
MMRYEYDYGWNASAFVVLISGKRLIGLALPRLFYTAYLLHAFCIQGSSRAHHQLGKDSNVSLTNLP